ncbi:MAG: DUF3791 domain-containing protein [Bacteroidales bacterium]|nr:DUF3791 domain-containing protein [Bacteroidales bacterium]
MLNEILLWNKIGRIIMRVHERLDISPEQALDVFYSSQTCERLHDANDYLYLMGDLYIVDELILELQGRGI